MWMIVTNLLFYKDLKENFNNRGPYSTQLFIEAISFLVILSNLLKLILSLWKKDIEFIKKNDFSNARDLFQLNYS